MWPARTRRWRRVPPSVVSYRLSSERSHTQVKLGLLLPFELAKIKDCTADRAQVLGWHLDEVPARILAIRQQSPWWGAGVDQVYVCAVVDYPNIVTLTGGVLAGITTPDKMQHSRVEQR